VSGNRLDKCLGLLAIVENLVVKSSAMNMAKQQRRMGRLIRAMVVLSAIALVFMFSIAIALNPVHGQFILALPIFFVLSFLIEFISAWLLVDEFFFQPNPRFSPSLTRGPPA
jgi:Kef-type K+ transport system membrane component KefB